MDNQLSQEDKDWMGKLLEDQERADMDAAFEFLFKQNLVTTGEDVSPSANLAAVYDHLQETSEYWDSKPVNELTFADLKHKCAYNWIHFKTRGHMTKTPPASPGKLGSAAAERVNFTICPVEQSHVPMEP